ncbi:hypothetical protein EGM_14126 [Macaca fascicularis]|uniref:Uncharacterized protein n=1 Tax=Macaca fascicularis TaxID=9541 RepID=G7P3Q3_MACFA|nr:hypothetical protein EGM_14126 [Macaca fascicularis]
MLTPNPWCLYYAPYAEFRFQLVLGPGLTWQRGTGSTALGRIHCRFHAGRTGGAAAPLCASPCSSCPTLAKTLGNRRKRTHGWGHAGPGRAVYVLQTTHVEPMTM